MAAKRPKGDEIAMYRSAIVLACLALAACAGPGGYPVTRLPAGTAIAAGAQQLAALDDVELCAAFRTEWVSNFVRHVYGQQRGAPVPSGARKPFADRMLERNDALWTEVRERGLDQEQCRVPRCFTRPHVGWWEPHCGYRIPNPDPSNGALYGWVAWREGVEPPPREAMRAVRQLEMEQNKRVRQCGDQRGSLC